MPADDEEAREFGRAGVQTRAQIAQLQRRLGVTTVYVTLGVRPEGLEITDQPTLSAYADVVGDLGSDAFAYCSVDLDAKREPIVVRCDARRVPDKGSLLHLALRPGETHVFDTAIGQRVGG